jgi:hypothetical protein
VRRWLRVLVVGVLTVLLSIDSASACRFLRNRCRPRCRVVTCRVVRHASHHCVPCDGSARAVIVDSTPEAELGPVVEQPHFPAPQSAAPAIVETPKQVVPQPVTEPLQPLEPIAPVSAEKPLAPAPATPPTPQPQFKSAAEILAESAEQERIEKAAIEAAKPPAAPAAEPQFKTAAEILAESAEQDQIENAVAEPPMKKAADEKPAPQDEPPVPVEPAPEPAPKKPAPKPAEENLFDEAEDEPAAEEPAAEKPAPMKKAPAEEPVEDLFGEPEAGTPADDKAPAAKESADEAPAEEKTEKAEDDPFAVLDASPEPVRRWIDATGRHQTIGRLVEVHPDRIRILKSTGHYTTVPLERLSRHDQSYVTQVGERIAAQRPAVTDTAQR